MFIQGQQYEMIISGLDPIIPCQTCPLECTKLKCFMGKTGIRKNPWKTDQLEGLLILIQILAFLTIQRTW